MNFTTMASIKIPAITPKRNILLRVHVLLTKKTHYDPCIISDNIFILSKFPVSRNDKMTLILNKSPLNNFCFVVKKSVKTENTTVDHTVPAEGMKNWGKR